MPVIGITGGIASGKSTVSRRLVNRLRNVPTKVESFSADDYAHELLDNDSAVRKEMTEAFGRELVAPSGRIDRSELGRFVFGNTAARIKLESILHPRIRERWTHLSQSFRDKTNYFVAEIPLLYETNCSSYFDCTLVVDTDTQIQLERLSSKRGWSLETARRVIDAQMPASEKVRLANILISNHHTEKLLNRQIDLAAEALLLRYA